MIFAVASHAPNPKQDTPTGDEIRDRLVAAGCDRDRLDALLDAIPVWGGQPAVPFADIDDAIDQSEALAEEMEQLASHVPVWVLLHRAPRFLTVPTDLRQFAQLLRESRPWFDGRRLRLQNVAIARLAGYVHKATGHVHDRLVADLINEAVGSARTEHDQRMWRQRHAALLRLVEQRSLGTTSREIVENGQVSCCARAGTPSYSRLDDRAERADRKPCDDHWSTRMTDTESRDLIDVATAEKLSGLRRATLYKLAAKGRIRKFKVLSRSVRFHRGDVERLAEEHPAEPQSL